MKFFLRKDGTVYWFNGPKLPQIMSMAAFIIATASRNGESQVDPVRLLPSYYPRSPYA